MVGTGQPSDLLRQIAMTHFGSRAASVTMFSRTNPVGFIAKRRSRMYRWRMVLGKHPAALDGVFSLLVDWKSDRDHQQSSRRGSGRNVRERELCSQSLAWIIVDRDG